MVRVPRALLCEHGVELYTQSRDAELKCPALIVERIQRQDDAIVTSGRAEENHMMFLWQLVNLELWLRRLP